MRFEDVAIAAFGYELAPRVVASAALEQRLAPVYEALRLPPGQIETLTGVRERRFWEPGQRMADGAIRAGRKALARAGVSPKDVGLLIYGGVCRDHLEPATACAVADGLGLSGETEIYDVSNACLGVVNGMVQAAGALALGHIAAGLVVSCESAREVIDATVDRLCRQPDLGTFMTSLATLTGGSGAVAVVLTRASRAEGRRRLVGGIARSDARHHRLCTWGPDTVMPRPDPPLLQTRAVEVLNNGVALGQRAWQDFRRELGWATVDKVICHQVGAANRAAFLKAIEVPVERDFSTFPFLGNIGTVSLPITAALAEERGFLQPGDRVGLLGIGSGLNCVMLGVEW
jgi:3-oxoacyl-[acyl-carrier-protein] synthase III